MVSEKLVMDMLAKAGVSAATKSLINSILSSVGSYINAKALIRYLNGSDGMIGYLMYHVAKVLKVRTIHSNEIDIYIDDVYEPLTLVKKQKTLSNVDSLKCDENIEFIDRYVNIIGVAGQGKSTILRKFFLETLKRKKELPIFIELRKLDEVTLFKHIKSIFNNIGFQTEDVHVRELLKSGVVVLLLDGFDEVQFNHRMKLLSEINDIVQSPEFDIKIII
ncbi:NACHT domain-containing protein, partial [Morganella morganii subsp. sibonii]